MTNIALYSSSLKVEIAPLGAELQSICDADGQQYLHDGTSFWAGRAPLLFPIVGALRNDRHVVDGIAYTMPRHGFARRSEFEVTEVRQDRALLRLTDNMATRDAYPYKFRLDAAYSLIGTKLRMEVAATNTDDKNIPVAFGFHPAFRWPLPGAGTKLNQVVDFAAGEPGPIVRLDSTGLLGQEFPTPVSGRRLALRDELFDEDALIFLGLNSRSLRFGPAYGGSPALKIEFEGMPQLGIWSKPGAPFICIEPWCGYASPADYSGPLTEKPGSFSLAPGDAKSYSMSIELV